MAPPQVVAARHWITYVDLLKDGATLDVDQIAEEIADTVADANASNLPGKGAEAAHKKLFQARVKRAKDRLSKARKQRTDLRHALLLDEE